jgi:hypothetical protein
MSRIIKKTKHTVAEEWESARQEAEAEEAQLRDGAAADSRFAEIFRRRGHRSGGLHAPQAGDYREGGSGMTRAQFIELKGKVIAAKKANRISTGKHHGNRSQTEY